LSNFRRVLITFPLALCFAGLFALIPHHSSVEEDIFVWIASSIALTWVVVSALNKKTDLSRPTQPMTSWKKLSIIGASVGAGIVVLLAAIGFGVYWYYFHPRPAREWTDMRLPQIGIKVTLSTGWRENQLNYRFRVLPNAPTEVAEFDKAIQTKSQPLGFSVFLGDSDGFKLCTIRISDADLQRVTDEAGKTQSLSADDTAYGCSLSEYNQASKWNVSWEYFPAMSVAVPIPKGATLGQPRSDKPPAGKGKAKADKPTHPLSDLGFKPEVLPNSASDSQGPVLWKDKSRWRTLQRGMSRSDVRKLLGEPQKIESGASSEYWYYSASGIMGAHVKFDENGRVYGWEEP
jgi:hypothetical protein